jgi:hypothetical protein
MRGLGMRNEFEDAHAALDWSGTQLPILEQEMNSWFKSSPYSIVEDHHPEMRAKFFKLEINRKAPSAINVGVGAVVSSIRTSLDLLACNLAGTSVRANLSS